HGKVRRLASYQSSRPCEETRFCFCFLVARAGILPPWRNRSRTNNLNRAGAVGGDATLAARSAFARAGFSDPSLILRWPEIAGAETARLARPVRLAETASGGVLTL